MSDLPLLTIDFEGKSRADLPNCGAWRYSVDPSTEPLCMAYRFKGDEKAPKVWTPFRKECPQEIVDHIEAGGLIEAHNSFFEYVFWLNVMVPKYGWPEPPPHNQWRCSMAKALVCSMPRSLGGCASALNLDDGKDERGEALIKLLCIPVSTGKHKGEFRWDFWSWLELVAYCQQDVVAEEGVSEALPDLTPREQRIWELDRDINLRGVELDIDLATRAIELAESLKISLNERFHELTGVERATMRDKAMVWLNQQDGVDIENMQAETLTKLYHNTESEVVKEAISIRQAVSKVSIGKYRKMLLQADPDTQRVIGLLIHHAATTGRWASAGVQLHNLPRGDIKDMDTTCDDIMVMDLDELEFMYGSPMALLSGAIRGCLKASEGKLLLAADYNAIEARSLFWLANDKAALNIFNTGVSIYCDMASELYGRTINKKTDGKEYNFGKVAILGLGYGMGYVAFFNHCRKFNITFSKEMCKRIMGHEFEYWYNWVLDKIDEGELENKIDENPRKVAHELALMKYVVGVYRTRYSAVTEFQDALEEAAIKAVRNRNPKKRTGPIYKVGRIAYRVQDKWLCCRLPSGRVLRYFNPKVMKVETPWGQMKDAVTYMAVRKGRWHRISTYGGKLAENVTQGTARDVLCDALIRMDEALFWLILHVHDEGVAEVDEAIARQKLEECVIIMEESEEWCRTLPVAVEAATYKRYRKD